MNIIARLPALIVGFSFIAACGKGDGTAKLAFEQSNASALTYAPDTFKMKLIAAYLSEDIDSGLHNNIGATSMFYVNPTCADDLMHCDISGGAAEDGKPITNLVNDFFDFSPGVDVNAALNAHSSPVTAASYKYVRLEFCKYNHENLPNVQWGGTFGGATVTGAEYVKNNCVTDSVEMVPPLAIAAGDTAVVTLSYSLADSVNTGGGFGDDSCVNVGASTFCFTLPVFTPAAHLE